MSPIKGLTDRQMAFPEIGQIRKGGKKQVDANGKTVGIGKDLQYFRTEFDERDLDAIEKFSAVYGDKPNQINIVLPFNEIDRVWDANYEAYTAGRLVARADGEKFVYKVDVKTGNIEVINGEPEIEFDPSKPVGYYTSNGKQVPIFCKPVGRLRVVIPELKRLAYLTVLTGSKHDIINLSAQLAAISTMMRGRISGIPLILKRVPRMISTPDLNDKSKRNRREKWLLSIEADPKWTEKLYDSLNAASYLALQPGYAPELGSGVEQQIPPEDDDENEDHLPDYVPEATDGEFSEGQPETETTQPETKKQETASRPYSPTALKERIQAMAETFLDKKAADNDRTSVKLNLISMAGGEDNYHALLKWLTGTAHVSQLADPQVFALKKWIHVTKASDDQWVADELSIQEAHAAFDESLKAQGQQSLL